MLNRKTFKFDVLTFNFEVKILNLKKGLKQMVKRNERNQTELNKTLLNFALIFKTDLETFEKIRAFLLKSGATLIYQTKSVEKIFVSRVAAKF